MPRTAGAAGRLHGPAATQLPGEAETRFADSATPSTSRKSLVARLLPAYADPEEDFEHR